MNHAITLSSPEGSFIKVNELLESDFFKKNYEKSVLIKSLVTHNTLGKKKAYEFINGTNLSEENKEFTKLWLSFYVKDYKEYDLLKADFAKKYPENYEPLKLRFRKIIDYRDKNIWNRINEDKSKSISSIDSLLTINSVNKEDKLYFSLMKLDFINDSKYNSGDNVLIDAVVELYLNNKDSFQKDILIKYISKYEGQKYESLLQKLTEELSDNSNLPSAEKVLTILSDFNSKDKHKSITQVESSIEKILVSEKNASEILKIKALVAVYSLSEEPDLGFFMGGVLKPINFSNTFKAKFSISEKQPIVKAIELFLTSPEFEKKRVNLKLEYIVDDIKNLSKEDLQACYGLMIFSTYFSKSLNNLKLALGNFQDESEEIDIKNTANYISFLEKNPLYLNKKEYRFSILKLNTDEEFFDFLNKFKLVKDKFKGSSSILKNGIIVLKLNCESISEANLQKFYAEYFKLIVDYIVVSKNENYNYDLDFYYEFLRLKNDNNEYFGNHFGNFVKALSDDDKLECLKYLNQVLLENPDVESLREMKLKINRGISGMHYLKAYTDYLINEQAEYYNRIDVQLISNIEEAEISKTVASVSETLKAKQNYAALMQLLPILYSLDDYDSGVDLLIYILNNHSKKNNFRDDFSHLCIQELANEIYDSEILFKKLNDINSDFPDFELNYLILTVLKMDDEKEHKKGVKMLKDYKKKSFPTFEHYERFILLKTFCSENYLDDKNIELLFEAITDKYKLSKNYFD